MSGKDNLVKPMRHMLVAAVAGSVLALGTPGVLQAKPDSTGQQSSVKKPSGKQDRAAQRKIKALERSAGRMQGELRQMMAAAKKDLNQIRHDARDQLLQMAQEGATEEELMDAADQAMVAVEAAAMLAVDEIDAAADGYVAELTERGAAPRVLNKIEKARAKVHEQIEKHALNAADFIDEALSEAFEMLGADTDDGSEDDGSEDEGGEEDGSHLDDDSAPEDGG